MIGNDIIDLSSAKKESNWKRKGYFDKIFTTNEQQIIKSAPDAEVCVWILWSMKEAAYKANNRITNCKEYAPIKINCELILTENNIYYGKVSYNNLKFHTKTSVSNEYIHTIALHNSKDFSAIRLILISNYPSNYIEYLSKYNYLTNNEKIVKNQFGIPNLYNEISNQYTPISISHHGSFLSLVLT